MNYGQLDRNTSYRSSQMHVVNSSRWTFKLLAIFAVGLILEGNGTVPVKAAAKHQHANKRVVEGSPVHLYTNSSSVIGGTDSITVSVDIASTLSTDCQITVYCNATSLVNAPFGWPVVITVPAGYTTGSQTMTTNPATGTTVTFTSHDLSTNVLIQPETR